MADANHTPGPWSVSPKRGAVIATHETGHDDDDNKIYYGGSLVCESIRRTANARLISAAPDLLAAAIAIRDNDVPSDEQWKAFEAAISKATGEA